MAVVWKHLAHPNVAPLVGVTADPIRLVTGWMPDVDLTGYITNHPDADRLSLVSVSFTVLCDVLIPSIVVRYRKRLELPPLLQRHSRGPQGGARSFPIVLPLAY